MKIKQKFLLVLSLILPGVLMCQNQTLKGHSHNDYKQKVPFYAAYQSHLGSIEADIWIKNGELYVAHDKKDIRRKNTLEALYIQPIVRLFSENGGKPWKTNDDTFQLLVELKSPTIPTLNLLADKLQAYPGVFNTSVNPNAIHIAITGQIPPKEEFAGYPDFIQFDGEIGVSYTPDQLKKIALISGDFANYTSWNGRGTLPEADRQKLIRIIQSVHKLDKKIRFWNAPDNPETWETFINLGIDIINTDQPENFNKHFSGGK